MTTSEDLPTLGTEPPVVACLSAQMREIQAGGAIRRVRTPVGDEGWLVTRHAELKQLLLDERVGKSHVDPATMPKYLDSPLLALSVMPDHKAARDSHVRMRKLLTPHFSAKRMAALRPRIAARANATLDKIIDHGPPADLHAELSVPVSFQVLCDLLGISEHDTFMSLLAAPTTVGKSADPSAFPLFTFLKELAAHKRAHPEGDLTTTLTQAGINDVEVASLVAVTAFSYLVTPHNISVGIALFSSNPDQREKVIADPALLASAVEEVVRMGKTTESFLPRYASEDIEIDDITIKAGELVMCDHYSSGFDDRVFEEPDKFDVTRSPNPHPAFSHGNWYCVGAPLARVEMIEIYGALLSRLRDFELEIPIDELQINNDQLGGGIAALPAVW
jgi:cytochrome P450 monooxygenase